jgi:peptidoglycan LD-endopeptidase CwlK
MYRFSAKSKTNLETCDPRLIRLFEYVVYRVDCSILCGHRTRQQQNALPDDVTQVRWPDSRHNSKPSLAVDCARYPIDWGDRERQTLFAGYVVGVAEMMDIPIIWGGDWNDNFDVADNGFDDLVHFQIKDQ